MKDLIAKLQMDANCALGAIWMHIDAQAARIAELEAQQAFGIGETYANALSRIAELEAQIAAKPADTDKLRESILTLPCLGTMSQFAKLDDLMLYQQGHEDALHEAANVVASTALQAPVREVPETAIPALVAALQDCLDYGSMTGSEWVADQAREAIKQATGGAK